MVRKPTRCSESLYASTVASSISFRSLARDSFMVGHQCAGVGLRGWPLSTSWSASPTSECSCSPSDPRGVGQDGGLDAHVEAAPPDYLSSFALARGTDRSLERARLRLLKFRCPADANCAGHTTIDMCTGSPQMGGKLLRILSRTSHSKTRAAFEDCALTGTGRFRNFQIWVDLLAAFRATALRLSRPSSAR